MPLFQAFTASLCFLLTLPALRSCVGFSGILALSLGLTFWLCPELSNLAFEPLAVCQTAFLACFFALPLRIIFETMSGAARLIDVSRGSQMGEQFNPTLQRSTTLLESACALVTLAVFFQSGFHFVILTHFQKALKVLPRGVETVSTVVLLRLSAEVLEAIILLAGPVLLVLAMFDLSSLVVSKLQPKFPVIFEFLPFRLFLGLACLLVVIMIVGLEPSSHLEKALTASHSLFRVKYRI